jgi:hypothetical protein
MLRHTKWYKAANVSNKSSTFIFRAKHFETNALLGLPDSEDETLKSFKMLVAIYGLRGAPPRRLKYPTTPLKEPQISHLLLVTSHK